MNRILQCRKVPILAPRRFFDPRRVRKIGESETKTNFQLRIELMKELGKNFLQNHKVAFLSFRATFNLGQGSISLDQRHF